MLTRYRLCFSMVGPLPVLSIFLLYLLGISPAHSQQRERIAPGTTYAAWMKNSLGVRARFSEVVAQARKSTVRIRCAEEDAALGIVVRADGWIITKARALRGSIKCVLWDGRTREARLAGVDWNLDLALLKIEAENLIPAQWDEATLLPGAWVVCPGTDEIPLGLGIVSVSPQVIRTWRSHSAWQLGGAPGGYLGARLEDVLGHLNVAGVVSGSPANKAGLRPGDRIVMCQGQHVDDRTTIFRQLVGLRPEAAVSLKINRGSEEQVIVVTLGQRAARPSLHSSGSDMDPDTSDVTFLPAYVPPPVVQHDIWMLPTECGGPLVTLSGKVAGMNILFAGNTANYALTGPSFLKLLDGMIDKSSPPSRDDLDFLLSR